MKNEFEEFIKHYLNTEIINEYSFKEINGLYIAFKTTTIIIHEKITNIEINPMGIIYTQNNEYYYAPFLNEDMEEIIKEFVEKILI